MKAIITRLLEFFGIRFTSDDPLFKDSGKVYVVKIGGLIFALLLQVFLARIMGADQFGVYVYILTWVNLIAFFSKLGFDTSSKRILSTFHDQKKWSYFKGFISFSSVFIFVVSILVFAIYILLVNQLIDENESLRNGFYIGGVLLIIVSQIGVFSAFLESTERIIKSLSNLYFVKPLLIILGGIALLQYGSEANAVNILYLNIVATLFALGLAIYWVSGISPRQLNPSGIDWEEKWSWLRISFPLLLVSGTHLLLGEIDVLILGIFTESAEVGVYKVATKLSQLAMFGFNSVELILAPLIAKLFFSEKKNELQASLRSGVKAMIVLTLPVLVGLGVLGKYVLAIYGAEFTIGYTSLLFLLGSQAINMTTGAVSYVLTMTEYQKEALIIMISALILNAALNLFLVPMYGMEGAAIATGISTIFWNVIMLWYVRYKLSLDPSIGSLFR